MGWHEGDINTKRPRAWRVKSGEALLRKKMKDAVRNTVHKVKKSLDELYWRTYPSNRPSDTTEMRDALLEVQSSVKHLKCAMGIGQENPCVRIKEKIDGLEHHRWVWIESQGLQRTLNNHIMKMSKHHDLPISQYCVDYYDDVANGKKAYVPLTPPGVSNAADAQLGHENFDEA